uniref:Thioredoxin domain-containing protein n=1 Tax=Globodera pallida TaxID=36090 RepID=A0A183BMN4_GLOPA
MNILTTIMPFVLLLAMLLSSRTTHGEDVAKKFQDIAESYKNPLSNGFGDDIDWVPWDEAIENALDKNKPIFLLIHKTWCHACKTLRKIMQQSNAKKAFKKLSEYFIMVNTADDDEPFEEEYRPDGKYVPRILFLDKNGDTLTDFKNKKAEYKNYAYYYSSPADILNTMKDVIAHYGIELPQEQKGDKLKPKKPPPKTAPDAPVSSNKKPAKKGVEEEKEQQKDEAKPVKKDTKDAKKKKEL